MKKFLLQSRNLATALFLYLLIAPVARLKAQDCYTCCERDVSNTIICSSGIVYGMWFVNDDENHFELTESTWTECEDGTAYYTATATNGVDVVTAEIFFTGATTTPPSGSPKSSYCGDIDPEGWVYYEETNGTVVSENHGTFYVERRGEAFQVGYGANITSEVDLFGGSGWLDIIPGDDYDGYYEIGDINLMLSVDCIETELSVVEEPQSMALNCNDGIPEIPDVEFYDPSDDNLEVVFEESFNYFDCGYEIVRTWTATNDCDQSLTVDQSIEFIDTEAPEINPGYVVFNDCEIQTSLFEVTDDCDSEPSVEISVLDSSLVTGGECETGQLRTQTIGGWGAVPNGNNPGVYLHEHFDEAFPDGLTIGCENTLTLTEAQAVTDFLPSGGTPSILPSGDLTDPSGTYNNTLASQLVALTISVTFDNAFADFGESEFALNELIIQSGSYSGYTVQEILDLGNQMIGSCMEGDLSAINEAISSINENYVDGTQDNGFLACSLPWDCYVQYQIEITATDDCGNSSSDVVTAYLVDLTPPELPELEEFITVECNEIPDPELPELDCLQSFGSISVVDTEFSGSCYPTIHRVWTITAPCGETNTFTQYITVVDTQAPVFVNSPENLILDCNDIVPEFIPEVTDNCEEPLVVFDEYNIPIDCGTQIMRNWVATDACGNSAEISQTIIVTDNEAPVFNIQVNDIEVECGNFPDAPFITASDNCTESVDVIFEETMESGSCANLFRTWTATDECGNTSVMTQTLISVDTTPPVITSIPENIELSCVDVPEIGEITATDNCDEDLEINLTENISVIGCTTTITRTWLVQDDCSNIAIASQTITLADTEAPQIILENTEVDVECQDVTNIPNPEVIDDCAAEVSISYTDQTDGEGCNYDIVRTYIATDNCGNTSFAILTIHVSDQTPPTFITSGTDVIGECGNIPDPSGVIAQDACSAVISLTSEDFQSGDGCSLFVERVWTATDACGNSATFTQNIIASDDEAPVFESAPEDVTINCDEVVPDFEDPVISDNCDIVPELQFSTFTQTIDCGEAITNIWTATDACGNANSLTQVITITDNIAPEFFDVPEDITVACDQIPDPDFPVAVDNCSEMVNVFFEEQTITGSCPYTILRTWTAIDVCGNSSSVSQNILVLDEEAPVFVVAPEDLTTTCDMIPELELLEAIDNCSDDVTVLVEETEEYVDCNGQITRTWTATDWCGNVNTHTQIISIVDTDAPFFFYVPEDLILECTESITMEDAQALDNCSDVEMVYGEELIEGECPGEFTLIRQWTATDACGQSSTAMQMIQTIDSGAPVLSELPGDMTVVCEEIPEIPLITATDNCGGDLEVEFTEEVVVANDSMPSCELLNAQGVNSEIALLLPYLGGFDTEYILSDEGATFVKDPESGTAVITGSVVHPENPNQGFIMEFYLYDVQDWDMWSAAGGSYKDDFGYAGDAYLFWDYYKMADSSKLIGTGIYEGTVLNLTHAPADYTFGFQVGESANNYSEGNGLSGWFFYEGELYGQTVSGTGDIIVESSCCQERDIIRTWTAVDCAGNETSWTQNIEVVEFYLPEMFLLDDNELAFDVNSDNSEEFLLTVMTTDADEFTIDVLDINGRILEVIHQGKTLPGEAIQIRYSTSGMLTGGYIFRCYTSKRLATAKSLVVR